MVARNTISNTPVPARTSGNSATPVSIRQYNPTALGLQAEFSNESFRQFSQTNFQKATFLEHETNPYHLNQFDNAIRKSPIVRYKDAVMMVPHFEPFTQRGKEDLLGVLLVWAIVAAVFFLLLLTPTLPEEPEYKTY